VRKAFAALLFSVFLPGAAHGQEEHWVNDTRVLACSPQTLKPGGSVTLVLGPNHGSELAIRRNGTREWYFLVVRSPPPEMRPFMTPEAFKAARRATLTERTEGLPWVDNSKSERVFSRPGRYIVHASDVLESEAGGYICTIDYQL